MVIDLRRSPRIPFIASAEVTDIETQIPLVARTCDISQHGCYVDMINPLPLGTTVKVEIANDEGRFGATAGVVYSQLHLGMGLVFHEIEPENQPMLEKWLNGASLAEG